MNNSVFGEVNFNYGWETELKIKFNEKEYNIVVSGDAYYEKEGITEQQEQSYAEFKEKQKEIICLVQEKINKKGVYPTLLLIKRNGDYGLVFEGDTDEDGLVVTIKPTMELLSTDQYF